jgi:hypothetical protein
MRGESSYGAWTRSTECLGAQPIVPLAEREVPSLLRGAKGDLRACRVFVDIRLMPMVISMAAKSSTQLGLVGLGG